MPLSGSPEPLILLDLVAPRDGTLVSVAVSLFNYENEIGACLASVLSQTHDRLELIVVDDCSTDGSAEAARLWLIEYADRFDRVLLLRQSCNQGLSAARNLAFEHARGEAVFVLDADNEIRAPAVARLLESLEDAGADVAYCQLTYFGEITGIGVANIWRRQGFVHDNYIDAMALVRRSSWALVGGYSPIDYGWEDYDFWCKFVEAGLSGVYVPELLCRYRTHPDSMVRTETTSERARLVYLMLANHPWLDLKA